MIALPLLTFAFAAWVPAVLAARKRDDSPRARRRLYLVGGAYAATALAGFVLLGISPKKADGSVTGPTSDVGVALVLVVIVAGTWTAVQQRNVGRNAMARQRATLENPDVQRALAARRARDHYRRLAEADPRLAREMSAGRPDLPRAFDDGGLLDINGLPVAGLVLYAGLTDHEAQEVVTTRDRFGRLSSVEELVVRANVRPDYAEELRDRAVFL